MYRIRLQDHFFTALVLCIFITGFPSASIAGEGSIDATNGDVYFNVHFRFPPTTQQITDVKAAVDMMSLGVCDATDGQMRVKRVTLSQGEPNEDKGDFWLHALPGRSGLSFFTNGANLGNLGSHVDMFSGAMLVPDVYLHEFGHHAWGLGDEYDEQSRFGGPCGIGPGFDAGSIDEQNHSIMQQSGSAQCVGGANAGNGCLRNSDCPASGGGAAGVCQFVQMSELSVASNNDPLQGNGMSCPAVVAPATMCPDNAYCMRAFNSTTNRYEQTQQSEMHNDQSDWETLDENYPFITPPAALPTAAMPATCFRSVEYTENVVGSDQVLLILDRSGSMSWSSNPADQEVCANGVDDDVDGAVDEATCGNARITFVTAAANAYLDLQRNRNVDVGILSFNETPVLDQTITTLNAGNIATYKGFVDGLVPGGNTGIGDALDATTSEFTRVASLGRSRTAYLMTDGYNTSGVDPVAAAERLKDIGVRVHVIPAGSDVSTTQLGAVAAKTGGDLFAVPGLNELTAVYAELAGRHRGAAMALPRFNFELSLKGVRGVENGDTTSANKTPRQRKFPIFVEKNAKALVTFVSGRNTRMSDWSVGISLLGPNGESFGPGSPELTINPYYLFIDVPNPAPGKWTLVATATGPALQQATALAFIDNPKPDFFVSARPNIISGTQMVNITANPVYVSRLGREGVSISGRIEGPAGFSAPVTMNRNETGAWSATEGPFLHNGFYRATLALDVNASAQLAAGESIFSGPATPPVTVTPFKRYSSVGFVVLNGKDGDPCTSGNREDCDGDNVPDKYECTKYGPDIDKDGRPNGRDPDADGDEIPDAIERNLDLNQNRVPDMCEASKPRTAAPPKTRGPTVGDNCIPIRRLLVKPVLVGNRWRLNDENVSLFDFGADASGARFADDMFKKYAVTEVCYTGRKGHSLSYLLANDKAPIGRLEGETCKSFAADSLSIIEQSGGYVLKSGRITVRTFTDKAQAESALAAIKKYGFNHFCVVGKDKPSLEYMRQ
jgi:von Willebrand factor type A domain